MAYEEGTITCEGILKDRTAYSVTIQYPNLKKPVIEALQNEKTNHIITEGLASIVDAIIKTLDKHTDPPRSKVTSLADYIRKRKGR